MNLIVAIALILLCLNVFATILVRRDEFSEERQRVAQLLFIWLVPIIGAIAIWGMYRSEEKPPGTYREIPEPDDDLDPPEFPVHSLSDAPDGGGD